MVYVEATVGAARNVLDPRREMKTWDTPDDVPALIFVASGRFRMWSMGAYAEPTPPIFTRLWIVVPLGTRGVQWSGADHDIDLSQLGAVHEVPLPLAPFPTPVSLATPEAGAE